MTHSTPPPSWIVAHRGNGLGHGENTLAAARAAARSGLYGLEIDVHLTADGEVVVHHDHRLDPRRSRRLDGAGGIGDAPIERMTLAEIDAFEIRSDSDKSGEAWETVPRLAEVLVAWAEAPRDRPLLIEMKTAPDDPALHTDPRPLAEAVVGLVGRANLGGALRLMSFDAPGLDHARRLDPSLVTLALTFPHAARPSGPALEAVRESGGRGWAGWFGDVDADSAAAARALGLEVAAWTVDAPEDMARLTALGVDYLITNNPYLACAAAEPA